MIAFYERVKLKLDENGWIGLLLLRLFVGYFFFETGWGKIHNLETFTQRFIEWGIPMPAFNAALFTTCSTGLGGSMCKAATVDCGAAAECCSMRCTVGTCD